MNVIKEKKLYIKLKKASKLYMISFLKWVVPIFVAIWGIHLIFHNSDIYRYYQKAANQAISPELWNVLGVFAILCLGIGILFKIENMLKLSGNFFLYVSTMGFIMIGVLLGQVTIAFSLNHDPSKDILYGVVFSLAFLIFWGQNGILWAGYYMLNVRNDWIRQILDLKVKYRIVLGLFLFISSVYIFYRPTWNMA